MCFVDHKEKVKPFNKLLTRLLLVWNSKIWINGLHSTNSTIFCIFLKIFSDFTSDTYINLHYPLLRLHTVILSLYSFYFY